MAEKPEQKLSPQLQETIKDTVKERLGEAIDEALEEQLQEASDGRPGSIHRGIKKSFSRPDIERIYQKATFIPEENLPVIIQGVRYDLFAGEEFTGPCVVKSIYDEYRANRHRLGRGVDTSMGRMRPLAIGALENP